MPRRTSTRVQPIRLGGRAVKPLQDHHCNIAPEPPTTEFNWSAFAEAAGLDRECRQYLEHKRQGLAQSDIAALWGRKLAESVYRRFLRAVRSVAHERSRFETPVRGGNSSALSYCERLPSGKRCYSMARLGPTFQDIIFAERKNLYVTRPKTPRLGGTDRDGFMQHKTFGLSLKTLDADGTFDGLLSTYNSVDQGNDSVEPNAFADSLRETDRYPLLLDHDMTKQAGVLYLEDSQEGLRVRRGVLNLDTEEGRRAHANLRFNHQHGLKTGLSIGYRALDHVRRNGVRVLRKIRLYEGSLTLFPMNQEALVSGIKHQQTDDLQAMFASFDREVQRIFATNGDPAFRAQVRRILEVR